MLTLATLVTTARRNNPNLLYRAKGTVPLGLFLSLLLSIIIHPYLPDCLQSPAASAIIAASLLIPLVAFFFMKWHRAFHISLFCFIFAFGLWLTSSHRYPSAVEPGDYTLQLLTSPKIKSDRLSCEARIISLPDKPRIMLTLFFDSLPSRTYAPGEILRINNAHVSIPRPHSDFDYGLYLRRHGFSGVVYSPEHKVNILPETNSPFSLRAFCSKLRLHAVGQFSSLGIRGDELAVVSAISVGERSLLSDSLRSDFSAAGISHVLVVSGMHVGFLFLIVIFLMHITSHRIPVAIFGFILLWLYAFFSGGSPSVMRAAFMFSVFLLFYLRGDGYNTLTALSLSAFVLTCINPDVIYDTGFQLSYTCVLSIILFMPIIPPLRIFETVPYPVRHFQEPHLYKPFEEESETLDYVNYFFFLLWSFLWDALRVSFASQILAAPLVAYTFHSFAPYFLLTNLAIAILAPVIFILSILCLIPLISRIFVFLLRPLLSALCWLVSGVSSFRFSQIEVSLSLSTLLILYAELFLLYLVFASARRFWPTAIFLASIPLAALLITFL